MLPCCPIAPPRTTPLSLIAELKRRNVFKVSAAYLALGWIVTQVTSAVVPALNLPASINSIVVWVGLAAFPFVILFSWAFELTPEGLKREREVDRSQSITHLTSRRLDFIIIGLLVVAIGLFVADRLFPRHLESAVDGNESALDGRAHGALLQQSDSARSAAGADHGRDQANPAPDDKSIAVLPFVDMSADKDQEYMSDGIAEELLNLLAQIPELKVTSRSSAFAFKGEKIDLADVAAKLQVAHILEGSVRKAGNRVRITAQLIDARSDKHLWSQSFDRGLDDIFAVQDEIAGAVVAQLKIKLLGEAPKARTTDPQAYALYLQAQQLRRLGTRAGLGKSVELLQQALAIDPNYPAAWEGLAANYNNLAGNGLLGSFDEGYGKAREAADKALALDPDFAPAHARLGVIAMNYDLAAAAQHFQRALQLAPTDDIVLAGASGLAGFLGRGDEVLALDLALLSRDPVNPLVHNSLGGDYLFLGRSDEAIASFRTALALSPAMVGVHLSIAIALMQKGELDTALAEVQQEPEEVWRLVGLSIVEQARGQHAAADAALQELITKHAQVWSYQIAEALAYRNEADRAFEWLDKAVAYKDPGLASIPLDRSFDNIRKDPRWLPFLHRIGRAPEQLAAIRFEIKLPP